MAVPDKFASRDVQRSFRKFNDLCEDIMSSRVQTWPDVMTRLIAHCESDPVMQVVTAPLKTDPRVNARSWWNDAVASAQNFIGSGHYSLPANDDERTALLYQILLLIKNEDVRLVEFCAVVYGQSKHQDMIDTFNQEIVLKFAREVSYRIKEVSQDTADQSEISREAIVVFHHHDYSTNITGNIQGSNVATGNAQISHSDATFHSPTDVAAELRALKSLAAEYSKTNRATIEAALDFLAARAEAENGESDEIVEHTRTVVELSPTIQSRLRRLVAGVSTSMVGSAIIEGIKSVINR